MEIQITKEKETPLLSRKRITAWVYYQGATPSRKDVLKEFAKQAKVDPKNTVIKHMYTRFGQTDMKVIANVYNDNQTLQKLESKNLIEKNKIEEAKAKEETKAESQETAQPEEKAEEETAKTEEAETKQEAPAEEQTQQAEQPEETKEAPAEEPKAEETETKEEEPKEAKE